MLLHTHFRIVCVYVLVLVRRPRDRNLFSVRLTKMCAIIVSGFSLSVLSLVAYHVLHQPLEIARILRVLMSLGLRHLRWLSCVSRRKQCLLGASFRMVLGILVPAVNTEQTFARPRDLSAVCTSV